ncbi:ATP-binding protein [Lysobacter sp. CA196]|uniref:ATP-binding protein n=1 Tax=Lysobacter sp. CA196 TaxID=3455606 RepID=UPI003F8D54A9
MTGAPRSAPTFLSLMGGLTLITIAVALAINFVVVLTMPVPPAPEINLGAAIAALRTEGTVQNDRLKIRRDCATPSQPTETTLTQVAADVLGVPTERLHARWVHTTSERMQWKPQIIATGRISRTQKNASMRDALTDPAVELPAFELALRQADGCWRVVGPAHTPTQLWRLRILLAFALSAALLAPLAWWLARRLSQPLRRLAAEAEQLSLDRASGPSTGPRAGAPGSDRRIREVQIAREAMHALHARLHRQADDMASMLAAVAHDLRTPLTALRLRVEMSPPEQAARMAADLERMDAMIAQVLDYARGQSQAEPRSDTDLAELVEECIDDARALGKPAQASRIDPVRAVVEPLGLRRALTNLIENAVRYADGAHVGLWREGGWIVLQVDDDGPGIPPDQSERLQEPFQRLETSRSRDTGGLGLGLAMARAAALRHGGSLSLRNRDTGGLSARLQWPARSSDGTSAE